MMLELFIFSFSMLGYYEAVGDWQLFQPPCVLLLQEECRPRHLGLKLQRVGRFGCKYKGAGSDASIRRNMRSLVADLVSRILTCQAYSRASSSSQAAL